MYGPDERASLFLGSMLMDCGGLASPGSMKLGSCFKCSISSASKNSAATCDFHASSCCLNPQVDAALSAEQLRQSLQTAFQQKQWQWTYLLRMAMTFMPATLGRSDDLRKLLWSCLALRTQDGVGPVPSVAILCGSMPGKTVKPGQVDVPGVFR